MRSQIVAFNDEIVPHNMLKITGSGRHFVVDGSQGFAATTEQIVTSRLSASPGWTEGMSDTTE